MIQSDSVYLQILLEPLIECSSYVPSLGLQSDEGVDLPRFQRMYGDDPLYHWIGLDSELMYAAHKAAGGMTSIYRQLGIGCERLLRQIIKDALMLSDEQVAWFYEYDKGDGKLGKHTLDVCIYTEHIQDSVRKKLFTSWVIQSARDIGVPENRSNELKGAVFEIRQGYKSADSKRQNADLRFGLRAYADANLLPVIAIVSTQASDTVCMRYKDSRLLVLRGFLSGNKSTFLFFRDVIGYDLADMLNRNSEEIRKEFVNVIIKLLSP
jgi:hypothetical protein